MPRPGRLTPGKRLQVRFEYEAECAPGTVSEGTENLASLPGINPRTIQPVASRYTD
jgi:hypothetical protein